MTPKFHINQEVKTLSPNLYGETKGKIVEVSRVFAKVFSDGEFDPDGLHWRESDLDCVKPEKYKLKGDTLTFFKDEYKRQDEVYKLKGFAYVIQSPNMNSIVPEWALSI